MAKLHLGVLGSGAGSNMQSIVDAIGAGTLDAEIKLVLADFPEGEDEGEVVRTSLSVLSFLLGNVRLLAEELIAKLEGADGEYLARAEKRRIEFFNRNEAKYQSFVDGFYFCMITEGIVKSEKAGVYASD